MKSCTKRKIAGWTKLCVSFQFTGWHMLVHRRLCASVANYFLAFVYLVENCPCCVSREISTEA